MHSVARSLRPVGARLAHSIPAIQPSSTAPATTPQPAAPGEYVESQATHLAVYSRASTDINDARLRSLALYRQWLRKADEIVALYYLELPASAIRQRVRQEFEKNRYVTDLGTLDILLWKGHLDLQETLNLWKQKTHIMRYFEQGQFGDARKAPFMDRFLNGRN
ncbi:hypothetical protein BCR44DRAFT_1410870 [Catenaria anguillulae PL171]|uniref:Complex 1 LYR protein domain-containing protein n=1 Tax=Catenaria anguillulae PL171 TaxID=765915 RepID=A0A1Y2I184_9FUNG|nr:hypothetical protein BCR44DRAFT_1410870 [Catenaria anguillulae PL171]